MLLWPEELDWCQDIGALAILDGTSLLDADGRFRIEMAREEIGRRLHRVPRFLQLLYRPRFGLGWPLWVDAASIDLAKHVREFRLPARADESQLLAACEELRHRRLRRSRPLWEMWFLPGLPDRHIGLFMKVHHTIADGVAGIAVLGAFVDPVPDPPRPDAPPWAPAAMPTTGALFADNLRRRGQELGRAVARLAHPMATARLVRRGWPAVREAFLEARTPRISLSRQVGWHRRLALIRSELDLVKRVAHAHHATVNDVLMVALAGGLRALLVGRGEWIDGAGAAGRGAGLAAPGAARSGARQLRPRSRRHPDALVMGAGAARSAQADDPAGDAHRLAWGAGHMDEPQALPGSA